MIDEKELIKIVEETRALSEDNNKILHSIQRQSRIALIVRAIYWVVIIGVTIGAFYYIQPYVDKLVSVYTGLIDTQHRMAEIPKGFNLETLKSFFGKN